MSVNITLLLVNLSSASQLLFFLVYSSIFCPVCWHDLIFSLFSLSFPLSFYIALLNLPFILTPFSLNSWDLATHFSCCPVVDAITFQQSNRSFLGNKYQGCLVKFSTSVKHLPWAGMIRGSKWRRCEDRAFQQRDKRSHFTIGEAFSMPNDRKIIWIPTLL